MDLFGLGRGTVGRGTLRPRKTTPVGTKGLQLKKHIDATLGKGNIMEAVVLPPGEAQDEWLAVNTVDFYNAIAVLFFTLEEYCTERTCEVMAAGGKYEYHWADGVKVKKPIRVSAPEYINKLFDWIEEQLDDEGVFPQQLGQPFPPNFMDVTRTIHKRLFRVYAHIYHSHFKQVQELDELAHLNTCFKHFLFFIMVRAMTTTETRLMIWTCLSACSRF